MNNTEEILVRRNYQGSYQHYVPCYNEGKGTARILPGSHGRVKGH